MGGSTDTVTQGEATTEGESTTQHEPATEGGHTDGKGHESHTEGQESHTESGEHGSHEGNESHSEGHSHGMEEVPRGPASHAEVAMLSADGGHHFDPHVVWVEKGGTVTWTLESGAHSTTAYHPSNDRHFVSRRVRLRGIVAS